jgi:hypothetical protein
MHNGSDVSGLPCGSASGISSVRNQLPQATILFTARRGCGDEFHSFISLCVSHTKASAVRIRAIAGAVIGTFTSPWCWWQVPARRY